MDDERSNRSIWTRRRFLIAAAAVAVVVILALALAATGPGPSSGDTQQAPQTPRPAQSAPAAAPAGDASVCGLEPGDQSVPVLAPVQTRWELVGTMAAPTAPESIGPGVAADGLRSCFARSPLGVLYAAANFLATTSDPGLRLPALGDLTATGEGRDRALELAQGSDPGGAESGVQIAGFGFLNYDEVSAVVDVALDVDGTPAHLALSLRWEAGDWKVLLPATGQPYESIQVLPNLTGYAPWAGA